MTAELAALGAFYGTPVDAVRARHGAALARYTEWVLARDSFALVTLGDVAALAPLGTATAEARFRAAAARWPDAITGVKLAPDASEPATLYVRTTCPWADAVAALPALREVPPARTLYGLGFQGETIKTYALTDAGFVSFRTGAQAHKDYRAEVAWAAIAWPDARWEAIGALGRRLGFTTAGHVGRDAGTAAMKVYVERIGAIATDRSLA